MMIQYHHYDRIPLLFVPILWLLKVQVLLVILLHLPVVTTAVDTDSSSTTSFQTSLYPSSGIKNTGVVPIITTKTITKTINSRMQTMFYVPLSETDLIQAVQMLKDDDCTNNNINTNESKSKNVYQNIQNNTTTTSRNGNDILYDKTIKQTQETNKKKKNKDQKKMMKRTYNNSTKLSIAISTDNTIIWYDHWEDGYESNLQFFSKRQQQKQQQRQKLQTTTSTTTTTTSTTTTTTKDVSTDMNNDDLFFSLQSSTTTIWGDKNASNGCAPKIQTQTQLYRDIHSQQGQVLYQKQKYERNDYNNRICTDENDVLNAGTVIQLYNYHIQNQQQERRGTMNKTKNDTNDNDIIVTFVYDGGDKILSSYPITVTKSFVFFPNSYNNHTNITNITNETTTTTNPTTPTNDDDSSRAISLMYRSGAVQVYDTNVWGYHYEFPFVDYTTTTATNNNNNNNQHYYPSLNNSKSFNKDSSTTTTTSPSSNVDIINNNLLLFIMACMDNTIVTIIPNKTSITLMEGQSFSTSIQKDPMTKTTTITSTYPVQVHAFITTTTTINAAIITTNTIDTTASSKDYNNNTKTTKTTKTSQWRSLFPIETLANDYYFIPISLLPDDGNDILSSSATATATAAATAAAAAAAAANEIIIYNPDPVQSIVVNVSHWIQSYNKDDNRISFSNSNKIKQQQSNSLVLQTSTVSVKPLNQKSIPIRNQISNSNTNSRIIPETSTGIRIVSSGTFVPHYYSYDTTTRTTTAGIIPAAYKSNILTPTRMLTSQVMVVSVYDELLLESSESLVLWVSPVEDAYLYIVIDPFNTNKSWTGEDSTTSTTNNITTIIRVRQYKAIKVPIHQRKKSNQIFDTDGSVRDDDDDEDAAVILIYARYWNRTNSTSVPSFDDREVDIAISRGHKDVNPGTSTHVSTINNPMLNDDDDNDNNDNDDDDNVFVIPIRTVHTWKDSSVQVVTPYVQFTYTIRIMNVGQTRIHTGMYTIIDFLDPSIVYVPNTTLYTIDSGETTIPIPDDDTNSTSNTPFPLDKEGIPILHDLVRHGDIHEISYRVYMDPALLVNGTIISNGIILQPKNVEKLQQFWNQLPYVLSPNITVNNTVYLGPRDHGAKCTALTSYNTVTSFIGMQQNTYCFNVTNTGSTFLANVTITNKDLSTNYRYNIPKILRPGESFMVSYPSSVRKNFTNNVSVVGTPVDYLGEPIPYLRTTGSTNESTTVSAADQSTVRIVFPTKKVTTTTTTARTQSSNSSTSSQRRVRSVVARRATTQSSETDVIVASTESTKSSSSSSSSSSATSKMKLTSPITNSVDNTIAGAPPRFGGNPCNPLDPGMVCNTICMEDVYNDVQTIPTKNGGIVLSNTDIVDYALICRAREVSLNSIKSVSTVRSCRVGETINLDALSADIQISMLPPNARKYDFGWYIAVDGGDALTGTCAMNSLVPRLVNNYNIKAFSSSTTANITWNDDTSTDSCGDIVVNSTGNHSQSSSNKDTVGVVLINMYLAKNLDIECSDVNDDGYMDFRICFSWRTEATNNKCDPTALYPGSTNACDCASYEVKTITIITNNTHATCL